MNDGSPRDEVSSLREEIRRLRKSLTELTPSLRALLRRRGFRIYKEEPIEDVLLPDAGFIDEYYRLLNKYSFRLFLRDVIRHQKGFTVKEVTRYSTYEVTWDYVAFLLRTGLARKTRGHGSYRLARGPVKSFGPTLEWFLSEIFKREFETEAIWGVKFKRPVVGGDYDLIVKINGSVLYMEVKSSPPKQIYANEISAFFDRVFDLHPAIAVFFMDTELRMKDKIVPMFEEELGKRSSDELSGFIGRGTPSVKRIEKELFQTGDKIYIINAKDSIVSNIERVLSRYFRGN